MELSEQKRLQAFAAAVETDARKMAADLNAATRLRRAELFAAGRRQMEEELSRRREELLGTAEQQKIRHLSAAAMQERRSYYEKREEVFSLLYNAARDKLRSFVASPDYPDWFCRRLQKALAEEKERSLTFPGGSPQNGLLLSSDAGTFERPVLFLSSGDAGRKELAALLPTAHIAEVRIAADIAIGGFRLLFQDREICRDETLDFALSARKERLRELLATAEEDALRGNGTSVEKGADNT